MDDIVCRVIELPLRVNAVTVVDENGDFNIYVNAHLSPEDQRKAYLHERRHIKRHHFYVHKPIDECEKEANQEDKK